MAGVNMSFGKMHTYINFFLKQQVTDEEGFKSETEVWLKSVRAYREGRHGSERWANRAAFTDATDLFRFRAAPDFYPTTDMFIEYKNERFEITSIEDVKGRGMYIEILARQVKPSG